MGEPVDTVDGARASLRLEVKEIVYSSSVGEHDSPPPSPTTTTSAPPSTPTRSDGSAGYASVGDRIFQHELSRVLSSIDTNTHRSHYYDTSISSTSLSKSTTGLSDCPSRSFTRPQAPTPGSDHSFVTTPTSSRHASAVISSGSIAPEGEDAFWPTSPTQRRSIGEPADWSLSDSEISDDALDSEADVDRGESGADTRDDQSQSDQSEKLRLFDGDDLIGYRASEMYGMADVDDMASFALVSSDEEAVDEYLDDAFTSPPSSPLSLSTIYEGSAEYASSAELLSLHSEWDGVRDDGDCSSSPRETLLADSHVALEDSDGDESSDSYIVQASQHIIDLSVLDDSDDSATSSKAAPASNYGPSEDFSNRRYGSGTRIRQQQHYYDGPSSHTSVQVPHAGQRSMFNHYPDHFGRAADCTSGCWVNDTFPTPSDRRAPRHGRVFPLTEYDMPHIFEAVEPPVFGPLPTFASAASDQTVDFGTIAFGLPDEELVNRLSFTPLSLEQPAVSVPNCPITTGRDGLALDQTHITQRTRHRRSRSTTVEVDSAYSARTRQDTETDEAEANYTTRARDRRSRSASVLVKEEEPKERWTASETLAILHGWSEEEALTKELELRYRYKDMAGPNTQSAAFIDERIRELEAKLACSKREKGMAAEMEAESSLPAPTDVFWEAKASRKPFTSIHKNHNSTWRDQPSPQTPTAVGVRSPADHWSTTGHSRNRHVPAAPPRKPLESEDATTVAHEQAILGVFKFGSPSTHLSVAPTTHEQASLDSFKFGHPTTGPGIPPPLPPRDRKPNFSHGRQPSSSLAVQSSYPPGIRHGHGRQPSFTALQMDALAFVDPKALVQQVRTPHRKRMRLSAPPMEDIMEHVVEEDSFDKEDWSFDSLVDISPNGTPSKLRRRLSTPPSLQGLVEEEDEESTAGERSHCFDDHSDDHGSIRPDCRQNRRTMEDALRAQIARGRSNSSRLQPSFNYSDDGNNSTPSEVNNPIVVCWESGTDEAADPIVLSNNATDEAMHGVFLQYSDPPPPHSFLLSHATTPPLAPMAPIRDETVHTHHRAHSLSDPSSMVSLATNPSTMSATRSRPRKMTPAVVAFRRHLCSKQTRAYRRRVDMKDGRLTIDMVVHGLMTTPVRPFPQRPPFEPTPVLLRRAPRPPPAAAVSQRTVSAPPRIPQRHSSLCPPAPPAEAATGGQNSPCQGSPNCAGEESGVSEEHNRASEEHNRASEEHDRASEEHERASGEHDLRPHHPLPLAGEEARQGVSLSSALTVTNKAPTPPRRSRVMRVMSFLKSIRHPFRSGVVIEGIARAQKQASLSKPLTDPFNDPALSETSAASHGPPHRS